MKTFFVKALILFSFAASVQAFAEDRKPATPERSKNIQFEDDLIEGMNRNPYDLLEHLGDRGDNGEKRLYKKKYNFHPEMKRQSREMGISP